MTKSERHVIFACLKFFLGARNDDERVMQLSKWLLQVPKGRNFHNRRQAKRSLRTAIRPRLAHGAQTSFGAQVTPVRTAERLE
jgi:hypothetical protein